MTGAGKSDGALAELLQRLKSLPRNVATDLIVRKHFGGEEGFIKFVEQAERHVAAIQLQHELLHAFTVRLKAHIAGCKFCGGKKQTCQMGLRLIREGDKLARHARGLSEESRRWDEKSQILKEIPDENVPGPECPSGS